MSSFILISSIVFFVFINNLFYKNEKSLENVLYEYNKIKSYSKSEFSSELTHTVLRISHKKIDFIPTSIAFLKIDEHFLIVLEVNKMLDSYIKSLNLNFKRTKIEVINFDNYFPIDAPKSIYSYNNDIKSHHYDTSLVNDLKSVTVYDNKRKNSYLWFFIKGKDLEKVKDKMVGYSFMLNNHTYKYIFNEKEVNLINTFFLKSFKMKGKNEI